MADCMIVANMTISISAAVLYQNILTLCLSIHLKTRSTAGIQGQQQTHLIDELNMASQAVEGLLASAGLPQKHGEVI